MTEKITVYIEKCRENAVLPKYATDNDAGADIYAAENIRIEAGETKIVPTGLKVAIPEGFEIQIRPRSGMSLNTGVRVANAPGTVDAGYRNEVGVILHNTSDFYFDVKAGARIAQMVLQRVPQIEWQVVDSVNGIGQDRGGGFGHSGH
jgi:dUTP pyrophosphatase